MIVLLRMVASRRSHDKIPSKISYSIINKYYKKGLTLRRRTVHRTSCSGPDTLVFRPVLAKATKV